MIWESIQFVTTGRQYFNSLMNILDLIRFYTTAVYLSFQVFNKDYNFLTWSMMGLNLIRGLTGFRAFGNTRYYIKLLQM